MPAELRGHRLFQRLRQSVKCFLQCCPRAGDIDSLEAFTILAEDGTTVQPELCFVDDQIFSFCFCQPKLSEIPVSYTHLANSSASNLSMCFFIRPFLLLCDFVTFFPKNIFV